MKCLSVNFTSVRLTVLITCILFWTKLGCDSIRTKIISINKMHIIIPSRLSSQNDSLCTRLGYPNTSSTTWHCNVGTLNELIAYNDDQFSKIGKSKSIVRVNQREVLLQPGIHYVNMNAKWSGKPSTILKFTGSSPGNVTILCKSPFNFQFSESEHITITNIHFKNCIGGHNRSTLTFGLNVDKAYITLSMIQITAKNCVGIILYATKYQNFRLVNSTLSTGNVGVYILGNSFHKVWNVKMRCRGGRGRHSCYYYRTSKINNNVNIINVLFQTSCLILNSRQWNYWYMVTNTTFVGCECSPMLSIHGNLTVTINDISVQGTQSKLLLYSTVKSLILEGNCYFYNNSGGFLINSSSNLNFNGATASFVDNTVTIDNSALPGAIIHIDGNSSVTFSNSHVSFENNHGHTCGGISARNATISLVNVSISFLGNYGEKSSAILLTKSQLTASVGASIYRSRYCFYNNNGSTIASSHSQLVFHKIKMEFIDNIISRVEDQDTVLSGSVVCANSTSVTLNDIVFIFEGNYGGIVATNQTNIIFRGNLSGEDYCDFSHNTGSILLVTSNSVLVFYGSNIKFINNTIMRDEDEISTGVVVFANRSSVTFYDTIISFEYNNYGQYNGGITVINATQVVFKNGFQVKFIGNYGQRSGAIALYSKSLFFSYGSSQDDYFKFYSNNGSTIISSNSELTFQNVNLEFINNTIYSLNKHVVSSIVMFVNSTSVTFYSTVVTFVNNSGKYCSGLTLANATSATFMSNCKLNFTGNSGKWSAAILLYSKSVLTFTGALSQEDYCFFYKNNGSTFLSSDSKTVFDGLKIEFINNTAYISEELFISGTSTAILANSSSVVFKDSLLSFENNRGQQTGGIMATNESIVSFVKNTEASFISNFGEEGGAISLNSMSVLTIDSTTSNITLTFTMNKARKGGAIFVDDSTYLYAHKLQKSAIQVQALPHLILSNNTALMGGNNIYGGWVDWSISKDYIMYNLNVSNSLEISEIDLGISSDPVRICMCTANTPDCGGTNLKVTNIYPGNTINIDVVAVGQRNGTAVAPVTAEMIESSNQITGKVRDLQSIQVVQKTCTTLSYTIMTPNKEETLLMTAFKSNEFGLSYQNKGFMFGTQLLNEYPYKLRLLFTQFTIKIKLNDCPLGFPLDQEEHVCICPKSLPSLGLSCDSTKFRVLRSKLQWIGITYNHTLNEREVPGIIAHQHCAYDYCKRDNKSLSIDLEHIDEQCTFNRTGTLCGGCQANFSRVVGSSKCQKCSNLMLLAIIPSSLLSGLLLIVFLMLLNLTVAIGTINGLIFYANIIRAQDANFFIPDISNSFLSKFIAWLNLDQGIESCLYDGLDSYVETWLQFCFPFYIWLLVIVIIVSSHYSTQASKLSGNNAVQVLATLFLLSYTKLLRIGIDVVSFTTLTFPDGFTKVVWLYDGNIQFLKGKHIPLFLITILLLVLLSIPYTLSLISIQWLFKISHYRAMFWVRRLKPLFDAYTGPYKANHRYWTGLLLLVRIILLIIFSLNRNDNPTISFLCLLVFSFILVTWFYFTGGIYESQLNNCLELTFLLNLGLSSSAVLYELANNKRTSAPAYSSTIITLLIFLGIIFYHAQRRLFLTKTGAKLREKLQHFWLKSHERDDNVELQTGQLESQHVTFTTVELTSPLLDETEERDLYIT